MENVDYKQEFKKIVETNTINGEKLIDCSFELNDGRTAYEVKLEKSKTRYNLNYTAKDAVEAIKKYID